MKDYYKIIDLVDGQPKTLFHGLNGSRILPMKKWLKADMKLVTDGSCQTAYMSGWHILEQLQGCIDYLKKFKHLKLKAIVRCKAKKIRSKAHSPSPVFLSEYLFIEEVCYKV